MRAPPPTNNTLGPGYRSGIVHRAVGVVAGPGETTSIATTAPSSSSSSAVSAAVPGAFPSEFWTTWRGEKGGSLMCCTDAYTGLVAISPTEIVVTYDMLATTCPASVGPGADCDSIISIRLSVEQHG
jgi:hypothetical protein